jgi:hypothetical protein
MLIFGKQVGDWKEKAKYAETKGENEHAEVHEVRCESIETVREAFAAMAAFAADTKCKKFLYHATINLSPGERLTPKQWMKAVDELEKNLKLTGHYRVVFEHIKKDRQHYHIVWSRLPPEGGAAVNMGNNYYVHQSIAKALEKEFGLKPAPQREKGKPSHKTQERNDQNGKIRVDPDIVTKEATQAFRNSQTEEEFVKKLAENGYVLTRGKNGSLVIVDKNGGYHGLMRRIEGAKLDDLRRKFPALEKMQLPALNYVLKGRRPDHRKKFKRAASKLLKSARLYRRRTKSHTRSISLAALIAGIKKSNPEEEKKYYPPPIMRRRRKKKLNKLAKPAPTRAEIENNELLAWAWKNNRLDILRSFYPELSLDNFEP